MIEPSLSTTDIPSTNARYYHSGRIIAPAKWLEVPLLTIGSLGTQVVWSSLMAFSSPYLLQLGLPKSSMAIVFVAGPLSGLLVAPYIGVVSDQCSHAWGRRRPFLVVASLACSLSLLLFGFARPIANAVDRILGLPSPEDDVAASSLTIALVIISIFGTDFTVNAISALNRALLLDLLPRTPASQSNANAYMARIAGIGSLLGFLFGNLDLHQSSPFKYFDLFDSAISMESQLKCLSLTVVLILISTQSIVCYVARESPLDGDVSSSDPGLLSSAPAASSILLRIPERLRDLLREALRSINSTFRELSNTLQTLHPSIKTLLKIQFFAWIGWFPALFYSSSWVAEIFKSSHPLSIPDQESVSALELDSTRAGSRAMLFHSLVSLSGSVLLPMVVADHHGNSADGLPRRSPNRAATSCFKTLLDLPTLWAASHFLFAIAMALTYPAFNADPPSLFLAFLVTSLTGLSWALTHWAPFALIGVLMQSTSKSNLSTIELADQSDPDQEAEALLSSQDLAEEEAAGSERTLASTGDKAGTILGLHNVSIVLPQFAVTILSSIIFSILEPGKETIPGHSTSPPSTTPSSSTKGLAPDTIGVVLRAGGVSSLVAGWISISWAAKYRRELRGQRTA